MTTYEFDRATALSTLGKDRYGGTIVRDFWVFAGPNGGYLAAMALRAALTTLGASDRAPRSMHLRYLAPPKEGDCELSVSVLRQGRSMTILAVTLQQGGRDCVSATVCASTPFSDITFQDKPMPAALPFERGIAMPKAIPLNERFDSRIAIGGPPRSGQHAETGGYLKLVDGRPLDMLALAAFWDCWPPAVFFRSVEPPLSGGVPTVEASVYFRRQLPQPGVDAADHVLVHLKSTLAHDGFIEEDGEIWSRSGQLLVQSRQLALCR